MAPMRRSLAIASTSSLTDGFQTKAGFEWAPAMEGFEGLTIFADGIFGSDDSQTLLAGVRIYFGEGSSLAQLHVPLHRLRLLIQS